MPAVELRSGAWFGDRRLTLTFPPGWDATVMSAPCLPALDPGRRRQRLAHPIESPALATLAAGKRRAAILIDDIMRPTPTAELLPLLIEELVRGGLDRRNITVVVASGAHQRATPEHVIKKIGSTLASSIHVVTHDPTGDLLSLGTTPGGTPVHVNSAVMACDLKIGVGGLYPHPEAGFSGGAKIAAPGICGVQTIRYLHDTFRSGKRGDVEVGGEFRRELEIIAQMIGLDFVVNVLLNDRREIADLFAGEPQAAHRAGCRVAAERYRVGAAPDADVIVANTYPFDGSMYFMPRGFWPLEQDGRTGTSRVAIGDGSMGQGYRGFRSAGQPLLVRAWRRARDLRPSRAWRQVHMELTGMLRRSRRARLACLVLAPHLGPDILAKRFPKATLLRTWDEVLVTLQRRHPKPPVRVAIYPCAPLQIPTNGDER
jgi:lactate racemase